MIEKTYHINTLQDWHIIAKQLLQQAHNLHIWCFQGDLGSGKTTLIKALCQHLGIQQTITSPTFTLIHQYEINEKQHINHCDFYREKKLQHILDIGIEDLLNSTDYTFIEWPQIIQPLLQHKNYLHINITLQNPPQRTLATTHIINQPKTPHP